MSTYTGARVGVGHPASTLAAALLGFFVITLDAVIVNVSLPTIRADLGGGITALQWVVDGYTLMFAALLLTAGSLSDRVGAKRAFGTGLVGFVAASAACGLAPTMGSLVTCRFVQGATAALMMPASMTLIGQAYPDPKRRARAVAAWAMGGAVASSSGPLLGGLLTLASWRLIFMINVPVVALALVLLAKASASPRRPAPIDWAGQVSGVVAMSTLAFAVIEAGAAGLGAPQVVTAAVLAVFATTAFVISQIRGRHPMVPLDLFRSRAVNAAMVTGFAFMVGFYGLPFVVSLFLQEERGLSSLATGAAFLPMMIIGLVVTPLTPRIVERFGSRAVVTTGLASMTFGLVAIAAVPATTPVPALAALMMLVGFAGPTVAPPVIAVLLHTVHDKQAGTASGVFNTGRQIGGALAVAIFGALLNSPAGFVAGMRISLVIAAAVAVVASAAAVAGLPSRPRP